MKELFINATGSLLCVLFLYISDVLVGVFLQNAAFDFSVSGLDFFKFSFLYVNLLLYRTYAPFNRKIYFVLPAFVFALYSIMLLVSLLIGEHAHIVYGVIYHLNDTISKLTTIMNERFLGDDDWLGFLLINWIGIVLYVMLILFLSFSWLEKAFHNKTNT